MPLAELTEKPARSILFHDDRERPNKERHYSLIIAEGRWLREWGRNLISLAQMKGGDAGSGDIQLRHGSTVMFGYIGLH
jgi:hypothetical protein